MPRDPQRFWIDDDEIEARAEQELTRAGLFPTLDVPAVNIERFVEGHLRASLDTYSDLEDAVLGQTEFASGRSPQIRINAGLTARAFDDPSTPPGAEGRWRATVAHEAAHVIFHAHLFSGPPNLDLFAAEEPEPVLHRCSARDVLFRGRAADWREVQANKGMAALLMPRSHVIGLVRREFVTALGTEQPTADAAEALVPELAEVLQVSKQALRIRLRTLGLTGDGRQRSL